MSDTDIVNHTDVNDEMNRPAGESSSDVEITDGPRIAVC